MLLKSAKITFDCSLTGKSDPDELSKQSFYLNIFNYLILFRIAEVMLTCGNKPKVIKSLTNYWMWQQFMHDSYIYINDRKIDAYTI